MALQLGSGAQAYGMMGRSAGSQKVSIVVMWLQNRNHSFGQQNASLPASERPELNEIKGLVVDLSTVAGHGLSGKLAAVFTDTASGASSEAQSLDCPADCKLRVPPFTTDIAVAVTLRTDAMATKTDDLLPGAPLQAALGNLSGDGK